jgi:hypothetical protein
MSESNAPTKSFHTTESQELKARSIFFESELEEFIKDGKVKTIKDLGIEADTFINSLGQ